MNFSKPRNSTMCLKNHMLIAVTETNNKQEIDDLANGLSEAAEHLA